MPKHKRHRSRSREKRLERRLEELENQLEALSKAKRQRMEAVPSTSSSPIVESLPSNWPRSPAHTPNNASVSVADLDCK